jgi:deoxyribonuclease-4
MLIGAHCSGGVKGAIDKAVAIGADAVQLFTQSPRTWRPPAPDPDAYERFRERREESGIGPVFCHAIYLVNLAAPSDDFYEKSLTAMRSTMQVACAIEADGVVFHVGSHMGSGFEQVLELCSDRTWLLMENSAGAGGTIGRSIEELGVLSERLDGHPRLGVCIDSCHFFVSGVDVTDAGTLDAALDELDEAIGLDRLRCLHVNDSKAPLGSNRDRHENIGEGLLGEKLGIFLGNARLQGLPAILEVPGRDNRGPDAEELRKTRELHAGRALAKARRRPRSR